jgi:tripartite-type tricarboxylate transporter receptor subunit TctC
VLQLTCGDWLRKLRLSFAQPIRLVAITIAVAATIGSAQAQNPAEFYKGKQLRLILGHPVGGDYDVGSRLLAKYLPRHIPGNPSIIVQNMPNGASIAAANYLYQIAPKDGTVFGSFSRNLPNQAVLGEPRLEADPRRFIWLGVTSLPSRVCVSWYTTPVKKAEDLFTHELIVPGGGSSSALTIVPTMLNHVLGMKFRIVQGYRAFPAAMLALIRGEVNGLCNTYVQIRKHSDLIRDQKIRILFHTENGPMSENPTIPSVFKFVKNNEQSQLLRFVFSTVEFGRPYVLPPGTPADRVAALRKAVKDTVFDADLLAEAKKAKIDMTYKSPEEIENLLNELYATPPELLAVIKKLLR